jgi:hypothetical protein
VWPTATYYTSRDVLSSLTNCCPPHPYSPPTPERTSHNIPRKPWTRPYETIWIYYGIASLSRH